MNRVGIGFDLHRLVTGRPLVLGGVKIEHHLGLEGHSDADVLLHALGDALLGAAGMGDIGFHFPPGDQRYHNISSVILLKDIRGKLNKAGFKVINADAVIIAESPLMAPYIGNMRDNIASALAVSSDLVSVKATTTEGLGICGRQEGIAAQAVVMLIKE